ncbi:MAG TPA: GNAT family N-acetyltransferase [Acidimicrobiales bacterium]
MEIRLVRPEEHERLGELTVRAYAAIAPPAAQADLDTYQDELRDVARRATGADTLVAVDADGTVLGGVTYVPDRSSAWAEFEDDDAAGIRMLAVDPSVQGRGIGEALTRSCIERAVARGRRQIVLHSTEWMKAAHRLYERMGFQRDRGLDWYVEEGAFWLLGFRLPLDNEG